MAPQGGPNPYLRTKILTASPSELRLMLYEGAIKFCRQAAQSLQDKDHESSYHALMRAQKIVLELSSSLNHQAMPELCEKLSALYIFIYRLLVDANMQHDAKPVLEAIRLLEYEKETWQLAMKQMTPGAGSDPTLAGAQQTAISTSA